jgi:hypothetical protein
MRSLTVIGILCLWLGSVGTSTGEEVRRLPTVMLPSEAASEVVFDDPAVLPLAGEDVGTVELPGPALETPAEVDPDRPPDARDGMFQKLIFQETFLAGGQKVDSFGMNDVELKTVLALPIPSRQCPLIITPGFAAHFLEGPEISDLPPRVYDAYVQFRWMRRLTPKLGMDLAVTPGVFSDFEHSNDRAFRITGYGAGMYTCSPTTKLILGVAYLDRKDLRVLPVGGIIWTPNDDLKFELMAPRPRIAHRLYCGGACTDKVQDWVYLAGEVGGGIWAIERADTSLDTFTYTDYRILLGVERKAIGSLDGWVEAGYVFGREIEYGSDTPKVEPPGTVLVRAGLCY